MGKGIVTFGDTEIEKHKFHQHRSPISIRDVDINKVIVSKKVSFGKKGSKYFIVYKDDRKAKLYVKICLLVCSVFIIQ